MQLEAVKISGGAISSYVWQYMPASNQDPAVNLVAANNRIASFIAPTVTTSHALIFSVTVVDANMKSSSDSVTITVNPIGSPVSDPPVANAGGDFSAVAGSTVNVSGSGSDSDGSISSYAWTQVSGPTVMLTNADMAMVSFVAPDVMADTAITLRLEVTDNSGATDTDDVIITIIPVANNQPPTVTVGADRLVNGTDDVTISANANDADGTIAAYLWSRVSGPDVSLINATSANVSFNVPVVVQRAELTLRITVTDDGGASASADIVITINAPPVVEAGAAQTIHIGDTQAIAGTAVDSDGTVQTYAWTQVSGTTVTLSNDNTATVSVSAGNVTARETIVLRLTVTDNNGATASDIVYVTFNMKPSAMAGDDQTVVSDENVVLNGSGTDVDGSIEQYLWTHVSGPMVTISNNNMAQASFTAPVVAQASNITLRLTVTDNDGGSASDDISITVNPAGVNVPPTAFAGDNQSVNRLDTVMLIGSGSDSDGTIDSYLWSQVSGPTVTLQDTNAAETQFDAPDVTVATDVVLSLTVTDNSGDSASDEIIISVYPHATLSGTVAAANATMTDSSVNDPDAFYADNSSSENVNTWQHITNPVTLGGYVSREGIGPGGSNQNADPNNAVNDVYHLSMQTGQVVNIQITDSFGAGGSMLLVVLSYIDTVTVPGTPSERIVTASQIESGTASLVAPADDDYFVSVTALDGAAFSYVLTVVSAAPLQTNGWSTEQDFVPGQLIVEYDETSAVAKTNRTASVRAATVGMQAIAGSPGRNMLLSLGNANNRVQALSALNVPKSAPGINNEVSAKLDTMLAAAALAQRPEIKSVRLNYIRHASAIPNDQRYSQQWHYPLINLPQAWDTTTGSADVIVAVIDTGILANHPDIDSGRLVQGYDFISDNTNSRDGEPGIDSNPHDPGDGTNGQPHSYHGTHVTGTVGAATDNSTGVSGVTWQTKIMPLRVLGIFGGTDYDIEQAIRYAAGLSNDSGTVPAQKADVINLSLGGPTTSTNAPQAYRLARQAGVIIVAAAGNSGNNELHAPAAYNGVVSVSAVNLGRQRASYSNYGSTIDVAAPGGDGNDLNGDGSPDRVLSLSATGAGTSIQYGYRGAVGTSMAAPHVAGVVALMKSVYPGLTPGNFDTMLAGGELTQDLGTAGRDNNFGHGLIDAAKAVTAAASAGGTPPAPQPTPAVLQVTPASFNFGINFATLEFNVTNGGQAALSITDITEDSGGWLSISSIDVVASGLGLYSVSVDRTNLTDGVYTANITVVSDAGTANIPVSMQVLNVVVENNAGPQIIRLIEKTSGTEVDRVKVNAVNGLYNYNFTNVPLGIYNIRSSSDLDNDGTLCEPGESCGAYPTMDGTVSSDIVVDGNAIDFNNLDFETGFTVNLSTQ
ncbi:PKD domain-containing protein [Kaarinaea lacus]